MTALKGTILALQFINDQYIDLAIEVIEENKDRITDLNLRQLYDGLNADGSQIEPFYTATTVNIKKRKGQPYNRVTLNDTGDFYKGITLDIFQKEFALIGTDPKTAKLTAKYGDLIIGLSNESRIALVNAILIPGLVEKIKETIVQYQYKYAA